MRRHRHPHTLSPFFVHYVIANQFKSRSGPITTWIQSRHAYFLSLRRIINNYYWMWPATSATGEYQCHGQSLTLSTVRTLIGLWVMWNGNIFSHTSCPYFCPSISFSSNGNIKVTRDLPKNVALGELYARYSLLDAHAGNSFCFSTKPSSSWRFHGNTDSMAVGVLGRLSAPEKTKN